MTTRILVWPKRPTLRGHTSHISSLMLLIKQLIGSFDGSERRSFTAKGFCHLNMRQRPSISVECIRFSFLRTMTIQSEELRVSNCKSHDSLPAPKHLQRHAVPKSTLQKDHILEQVHRSSLQPAV
ncbi:hypothetical protein M433DRAFT_161356, partial [Acidomyces richmondensis BFW]